MVNIKLPKVNVQKIVDGAVKKFPKYKKKVGEFVPVAIDKVNAIAKPVGEFAVKYWKELAAGGAGGVIVADDIHQRVKRKQELNRHLELEKLHAKAEQKQDAEIKVLKEKADKVDEVVALNELLCDAIKEMKDGGSVNEETETEDFNNRTAD